MLKSRHITVFEHQSIRLNDVIDGEVFDQEILAAFESFYGDGLPYYSLINKGVRFNEYVGVICVGNFVVEVLPKADNNPIHKDSKKSWRDFLIGMMRSVEEFNIHAPSSANLKIKPNSILDLYFEIFVKEVEYLLHVGLVKKYRRTEGNANALKGNLLFSKHIQNNLIHKERFYVSYTTYDVDHQLHQILYKTIKLLSHLNTNVALQSRIGSLALFFPEMIDVKVTEATFNKLVLNRKTQGYKNAIDIAKLLLLQFHPDVSKGKNDVLALMFDMNLLWEKFVYKCLYKGLSSTIHISKQRSKSFWKPKNGNKSSIRPDVVLNEGSENCIVFDTKWKNLNGYNPSPEDLRQMFVYHEYFSAKHVALIYPSENSNRIKGNYFSIESNDELLEKECSIVSLTVKSEVNIADCQKSIYSFIANEFSIPINT